MLKSFAGIEAEEAEGALQAQAKAILEMAGHEHWPQHLEEAQRALRLFSVGTRLHEAGRNVAPAPKDLVHEESAHDDLASDNLAGEKSTDEDPVHEDLAHKPLTHEDLIREGYVIFLVGPSAYMNRLGAYYALHIMAFCDALYQRAGSLRVIADEFTNTPLKSLVESLTTLRAFGGEIHMIAQSRSEIIRRFGEQETRTIEENAIVKQWFGFSSFEEAERVSKAMGEQHAVASGLSGDSDGMKSQTSLSLIKQRWMSPAELMAMPPDQQLIHIKGVGFFVARTLSQQNFAPYCNLIAENPLEGGRLPPDPKITLTKPEVPK
jgi:type IV secretion system protein VirD4